MTAAPDVTDTVRDPAVGRPSGRGRRGRVAIDPPDLTIVTGAGGWLGRALVDHLVRDGGPVLPARFGPRPRPRPRGPDGLRRPPPCRAGPRRHPPTRRAGPALRRPLRHGRRRPHRGRHPSRADRRLRGDQRPRHGQRHGRRARPRRAPRGPRLVQQPVRDQPPPGRHVPQRRALPPVLRLRTFEDAGRAAGAGRGRPGPRRGHRPPAVVLRAVPARPPDDLLPHGPHRAASR